MAELDLEGVDPLRHAEIRKRVRIVQAYIDANVRDQNIAKGYAKQLNLSYSSFMRLVQIWKQHKDPSKLHGAGANRRKDRPYQREMPADTKCVVEQVIGEVGTQVRLVDLVRLVNERCTQEGIPPANKFTVNWMLMKARSKVGHGTPDQGIVVGACRIKIPVLSDEATVMPRVLLAIKAVTGEILATDIAIKANESVSVDSVLANLDADGHVGERITVPANYEPSTASDNVRSRIVVSTFRHGKEAGMILGRWISGLGLLFQQKGTLPASSLLKTREDRPLSEEEARDVIATAISRHNDARRAHHGKSQGRLAA